MSDIHKYEGEEVTVTWDRRLCIHIGECGRADNDMFEGGRKPWCSPDLVDDSTALDVVERCPTGSLAFEGAKSELPTDDNTIVVANNGPLYLRGELNINGAADDMAGVKFRAALCRCGLSSNKPFCDNSHEEANFRDRGAVGKTTTEPLEEHGGELVVSTIENGPLILKGNLKIVSAAGRVAWEGEKAVLCRCGESKNKPFCDGAHRKVGFQAP